MSDGAPRLFDEEIVRPDGHRERWVVYGDQRVPWGPRACALVSRLLKAKTESSSNRITAVSLLAALGEHGTDLNAVLIPLLDDDDELLRATVIRRIAPTASIDPQARTALVEQLRTGSTYTRMTVVGALGSLRPVAGHARSALLEASRDKEALVRREAVLALCRIDVAGDDVMQAIEEALGVTDLGVPPGAVRAIRERGERAWALFGEALAEEEAHCSRDRGLGPTPARRFRMESPLVRGILRRAVESTLEKLRDGGSDECQP